ncbi:hypothetical protein [Phaeobacter inhibens]|uniref:hypothetical protein n=1 Tax=Phaeobacter inhibens TaxID=221822 RepID=UPI000CA26A62|nr:hypothetical protein [Phaeobacter inhibens]AUQ59320.1 hypothetical protein PhaeoP30_02421 [Phaeobacter inhibens]AUR08601.1 hypothetical protein PhaeoP59_02439 [Phaeobacter inhibens]AUR12435.1 hypothetical protein PhaeoP48_02458 [Phaeobacter inhibens]
MRMICLGLLALAEAVALREAAVSSPIQHVLVQMPLLVLAGAVAGWQLSVPRHWAVPLLLTALTALLFWMLPLNVDWALMPAGELVKYASLPLLLGLPLRLSWPWLGPILRGFIKANALSMLGVLGFLYTHAPVRICNSYLVSAQQDLGFAFLYLAAALACLWAIPVLFGHPRWLPLSTDGYTKCGA